MASFNIDTNPFPTFGIVYHFRNRFVMMGAMFLAGKWCGRKLQPVQQAGKGNL